MTTDAPDTLLLRPSRAKNLLLLAVSAAFTAGGATMIRDSRSMGWFVLVFFGLCSIIFMILLLPNSSYLRLTRDGLETRSLFRSSKLQWADVASFRAGRIGLNAMVLVEYAPSYRRARTGRAVATALAGAEGALPDTYGRSAKALAGLLNEWRARATQRPSS